MQPCDTGGMGSVLRFLCCYEQSAAVVGMDLPLFDVVAVLCIFYGVSNT